MCVLSIKLPIRNKSGNLFNDTRTTDLIGSKIKINLIFKKDKFN